MTRDYKKVLLKRFYPIPFGTVRCNFREWVKIIFCWDAVEPKYPWQNHWKQRRPIWSHICSAKKSFVDWNPDSNHVTRSVIKVHDPGTWSNCLHVIMLRKTEAVYENLVRKALRFINGLITNNVVKHQQFDSFEKPSNTTPPAICRETIQAWYTAETGRVILHFDGKSSHTRSVTWCSMNFKFGQTVMDNISYISGSIKRAKWLVSSFFNIFTSNFQRPLMFAGFSE